MSTARLGFNGVLAGLLAAAAAGSALADEATFSTLYRFETMHPVTFANPLGSQPDTRPVLGPDHSVYGMTFYGGVNGNGVIYRFDRESGRYVVLHTFGALDASGTNNDGATPGVALTRGPDDVFYGMTQYGGKYGNGTIFKIQASGEFTLLHTFSAVDVKAHNLDGANPLRSVIIGHDGNLYGTTRLGGKNTCGAVPFLNGCGVAWMIDRRGNFSVLHQFVATQGHAASLTQGRDGLFYGCAVWPSAADGSGLLYRMAPSGQNFEVLYSFTPTDAHGTNKDGANCYEPLVETSPGVFYGAATFGGPNGNGLVFSYSVAHADMVRVVHAFSATNSSGQNSDGANSQARLTPGDDGALYSTASNGGAYGNGVVYRISSQGRFEVLHTFSATNPITGANGDGATPDFGVVMDDDNTLIGMCDYGGRGAAGGFFNSAGTLYRVKVDY